MFLASFPITYRTDENNRADFEKRSRLVASSPPAKRIKKVVKRNERNDLSLGTRLITGTREKRRNRLIDRETRIYRLSSFRVLQLSLLRKKNRSKKFRPLLHTCIHTRTHAYIYIYILVKRINSPAAV